MTTNNTINSHAFNTTLLPRRPVLSRCGRDIEAEVNNVLNRKKPVNRSIAENTTTNSSISEKTITTGSIDNSHGKETNINKLMTDRIGSSVSGNKRSFVEQQHEDAPSKFPRHAGNDGMMEDLGGSSLQEPLQNTNPITADQDRNLEMEFLSSQLDECHDEPVETLCDQPDKLKKYDFLTLIGQKRLRISQILELPKIALQKVKGKERGFPEMANFLPENTQVQFLDDDKVQFVPKDLVVIRRDYKRLDDYNRSGDRFSYKAPNVYYVGKILEDLKARLNIQDFELDVLISKMLEPSKTRIKPDAALRRLEKIQFKYEKKQNGLEIHDLKSHPLPILKQNSPQKIIQKQFLKNILEKNEIHTYGLELQDKWFLKSKLTLAQKLELPLQVMQHIKDSGIMNEAQLLDFIPENTLVNFENGKLQFHSKKEVKQLPKKYIPSKENYTDQILNKHAIGVMLEDIQEKKKNLDLEFLITSFKKGDICFSFLDAIKIVKQIQTRLLTDSQ